MRTAGHQADPFVGDQRIARERGAETVQRGLGTRCIEVQQAAQRRQAFGHRAAGLELRLRQRGGRVQARQPGQAGVAQCACGHRRAGETRAGDGRQGFITKLQAFDLVLRQSFDQAFAPRDQPFDVHHVHRLGQGVEVRKRQAFGHESGIGLLVRQQVGQRVAERGGRGFGVQRAQQRTRGQALQQVPAVEGVTLEPGQAREVVCAVVEGQFHRRGKTVVEGGQRFRLQPAPAQHVALSAQLDHSGLLGGVGVGGVVMAVPSASYSAKRSGISSGAFSACPGVGGVCWSTVRV